MKAPGAALAGVEAAGPFCSPGPAAGSRQAGRLSALDELQGRRHLHCWDPARRTPGDIIAPDRTWHLSSPRRDGQGFKNNLVFCLQK